MALFPSAVISVLIVWGPKLADPVIKKTHFYQVDHTIGPETSNNSTFCYWLGDGEV